MDTFSDALHAQRLARWHQTQDTRIMDAEGGALLIDTLGLVTLYPVSSELPNLFAAYSGDAAARTDSNWDSPSGEVYTWRWLLGRRHAGFYTALVRSRPTWLRWTLLSAIICLCGETRTPDELYDASIISADAYRVARTLEEAGSPPRWLRRAIPNTSWRRTACLMMRRWSVFC
jgi:hypothetical protein